MTAPDGTHDQPVEEEDTDRGDDIGLGVASAPGPLASSIGHNEIPIYPHGFSVRIDLLGDRDTVIARLERLGWGPGGEGNWTTWTARGGARRSVLRGSTWLSGRSPRKTSALGRLNKAHGTRLYSVGITDDGNGSIALDLHGVRGSDVRLLVSHVLGLDEASCEVKYFRAIERYIVLSSADAHRLAGEVVGAAAPTPGRGRLARKDYLLRDMKVPIKQRGRTKHALLNAYRIRAGATSAWKAEVSLRGRSDRRSTLGAEEVEKLDAALLDLVRQHQLNPLHKPDRWEPLIGSRPISDERLSGISAAAYRGKALPEATISLVAGCHTPACLGWVGSVVESGAYVVPACIRPTLLQDPPSEPHPKQGVLASVPDPHDTGHVTDPLEAQGEDSPGIPPSPSPSPSLSPDLGDLPPSEDPTNPSLSLRDLEGSDLRIPDPGVRYTIQGSFDPLAVAIYRRVDLTPTPLTLDPNGDAPSEEALPNVEDPVPSTYDDDPAPDGEVPSSFTAPPTTHPRTQWTAVAAEVARTSGHLTEVIIHHDVDPGPLLEALAAEFPKLGVLGLSAVDGAGRPDTWWSVRRAAEAHPVGDTCDCLAIHCDTSLVYVVADAIATEVPAGEAVNSDGEVLEYRTVVSGPLIPQHYDAQGWDALRYHSVAVGALLWDLLHELRSHAELTGLRIVVVSTDARPSHGMAGWRDSHRYTDARVRSHIGDAGRYWCHLRLCVEPWGVATTRKDEVEGRTGRYVYGGAPPLDILKAQKHRRTKTMTEHDHNDAPDHENPTEVDLDWDAFHAELSGESNAELNAEPDRVESPGMLTLNPEQTAAAIAAFLDAPAEWITGPDSRFVDQLAEQE